MLLDKNKKGNFNKVVRQSKNKKKKNIAVAVFVIGIIVVLGLYFCVTQLFTYEKLEVKLSEGSEKIYTEEQLEKGLGIKKGMGLYEIDKTAAMENAKYNLPYIKSLELSRRWTSTISAEIVYEEAMFYVKTGNELYLLNKELKVLEKTNDIEKIEINAPILLEVGSIERCIVGEKIVLDDGIEDSINNIVSALERAKMLPMISRLDISNKFAISLDHTSKFQIKLGDDSYLETKILLAQTVVGDKEQETVGGIIDVSDEQGREAIYRKYN